MYTKRWNKVKRYLRKENANAFIFKVPSNIRYLYASHLPSNSSLATFLIVFRKGRSVAITSSLEAHRSTVQGTDKADLHIFTSLPQVKADSDTYISALKKVLKKGKAKKVLCDSAMKVRGFKITTDNFLACVRMVKDKDEMKRIRKACRITDIAAKELPTLIAPKSSERKVQRELNYIMKKEGADSFAFETSVASGPNSAFPHHDLSNRKFRKGDPVTTDFGAQYMGYCADLTRTTFAGTPKKELKDIYEAVLESQKASIKAVRPGATFHSIDKASRDVITEYGYGEFYVHSTGHGIGLDVHEEPRVSPRIMEKVRKGMVFTIEPGIYIPRLGGVRIEDDVHVGDRTEILNRAKK